MTRREEFVKKEESKIKHCSAMSNAPRFDLNSKSGTLKLHDKYPKNKCNCQKQRTFVPNHFQRESAGFGKKLQKIFESTQRAWNRIIEPGVQIATPLISAAV